MVTHRDVHLRDGLRLHVAMAGDGPPLLLLHGFTGSADTWMPLRPALAAEHTVIAVDLPGHGRSDAPREAARYALPRVADDLVDVLDTLGIPRTAVLGYSLGGRAALHFAARYPDRLTALVLESVSPGISDEKERVQRLDADATLAEAIEREGIEAFVARWEALPLWNSQRSLSAEIRAALRAQRLAGQPHGLANSLRGAGAAAEHVLDQELARLTMPTLVVAGALDEKYVAISRALAVAMPDARLAVVPNSGHAVHLERPDELVALVQDFLRFP